jgi:hypothetical protein
MELHYKSICAKFKPKHNEALIMSDWRRKQRTGKGKFLPFWMKLMHG